MHFLDLTKWINHILTLNWVSTDQISWSNELLPELIQGQTKPKVWWCFDWWIFLHPMLTVSGDLLRPWVQSQLIEEGRLSFHLMAMAAFDRGREEEGEGNWSEKMGSSIWCNKERRGRKEGRKCGSAGEDEAFSHRGVRGGMIPYWCVIVNHNSQIVKLPLLHDVLMYRDALKGGPQVPWI